MSFLAVAILISAVAGSWGWTDRVRLEAGGKPVKITSPGYPSYPPNNLKKEWMFFTEAGSRIRITCSDFRLIPKSNSQCGAEAVTISDGTNVQVLCGGNSGFTTLSSSNWLNMNFTTGNHGRGTFKCEVQGRKMGPGGEVSTMSDPPPYLNLSSEEIDSTEHGGPRGPKSTNCDCGRANKAQSRIVNGSDAGVNEFPFVVALIDNNSTKQFCGGSIVTPYHVLTAAHCTRDHLRLGAKMSVAVGDHNLKSDQDTSASRLIAVKRILQHEYHDRFYKTADISLLLLAEKIEFNQMVGPVCLSKALLEIPRQYVKIIGWGRLKSEGDKPTVLQKVNVRVLHMSSCHRVYDVVSDVRPSQICTYSSQKASCQGDSGGPVVWVDPETNRYVLVGLVSFGRICADTNPTVHTDVSAYYEWIQANIRESMPQETCSKID